MAAGPSRVRPAGANRTRLNGRLPLFSGVVSLVRDDPCPLRFARAGRIILFWGGVGWAGGDPASAASMRDRLNQNDVTNRVNVEDPLRVRDAVLALFAARY